MYTGKNPKAVTSQEMLSEALIELLKEKEFKNINVKTLCEEALVSRQTFYSLFGSKEGVIEYNLSKYFDEFNSSVMEEQNINIHTIAKNFVQWTMKHESFLSALVKNDLMHLMIRQIKNNIKLLRDGLKIDASHVDESDANYAQIFIAGALTATVENYISSDKSMDTDHLTKIITDICTGKFFPHTFPQQ